MTIFHNISYQNVYKLSYHFQEKTVRKKEGDEYVRHTVKIDHKSEHQLFSKTIEVVTNEEGSTVLENGENEYPFTMTLPKDLPSSYHTVFGWGLDYGKEHGKDFVIGYKIHIIMFI